MRAAQTFQNKPTDHAKAIMKMGIPQPPHYPIRVKRVHGPVHKESQVNIMSFNLSSS